jgi:glycosyltransferase involved in cell wall biosynthesis
MKRRIANNYVAVTPSQWLADIAMSSGMFDSQPVVIPHFVDSGLFRPLDRTSVRRVLGVPEDRFVVLLASGYIHDRFKGFDYALATLHRIENLRPFVIVVGRYNKAVLEALAPFDTLVTGYISDDRLLTQFYATPDVMLYPSLVDSFGLAVLEAQACGTAVVGFASGAIPEIVSHLKTGWLSPTADIDGLVAGLRHVSQYPDELQRWGLNARQRALERYSRKRFLEAYLAVYRRVLDGKFPSPGQ